jgi:tetratricopeptide (TPR) repeat protein
VERLGRSGDGRVLALFLSTRGERVEEALQLAAAERQARPDLYSDDAYAWALYRAGRLDEARAASDRALRLGTPDARLLYHAGAIRLAAGERAAGRALVRRALALNPGFDWFAAAEAGQLLDRPPVAARAARR